MNVQIIEHLAWTLAHFIWQGALIALLAGGLKSALPHSAEWRYRISVGALALMLSAPLVTFALYPVQSLLGSGDSFSRSIVALGWGPADLAVKVSIPWTAWIVSGWIVGVFILSLRLIVGWNVAQRLVRTATNSVPESARSVFARLIARMPMRRGVQLLISDRVPTAVVIGWLKPVILLPLAAATGLTFEQLEAILAHELAHIRRHDFAINVLQCCAECLLFYHPAVWWMSSEIRRERENCCDDLAISICGDRVVYASALVELETTRGKPMLAMAASGSELARRIHRIFGQDTAGAGWKDAALASVLVLAVLAGSALYGVRAEAVAAITGRSSPTAATWKDSPPALASKISAVPTTIQVFRSARPMKAKAVKAASDEDNKVSYNPMALLDEPTAEIMPAIVPVTNDAKAKNKNSTKPVIILNLDNVVRSGE